DRIKLIIAGIAATESEPEGDDAVLIAALDAVSEGTAAAQPAVSPALQFEPEPPAVEPFSKDPTPTQPVAESAAPPAQPAATPEAAAETNAGNQTIRVGVDVLEELMTLVSELVLTRNQLLQLARTQDASGDGKSSFTVPLQRLSHITTDLQEGV